MNKKRLIILLILLLVAGSLAWYFLLRGEANQNGEITLYGNVDIRQVDLGFRVSGRIETMRYEEGDEVRAGDLLAVLNKRPLEDEVRLARAQVEVAEAELLKLETGTRPQEIAQAQAQVEERETTLRNAERYFQRQRDLHDTGAVSKQAYDDAMARRNEAKARLQSAREGLRLAQEGFREEDVLQGRANLRAAKARLAEALTRLDDADLYAPSDGVILTRVREPGTVVAAGSIAYTLSLHEPVWVRAYVPEPQLGRIYPGLPVQVYTDTSPNTPYEGQVGFVSPQAEFTPKSVETTSLRTDLVYRIRVIVEKPDKGLRQGMPVTVVARPAQDGKQDKGQEQVQANARKSEE
ncbi:secretion protein HlyD [Desulfocurvibacter africanus]|uniref:Secretion protein HlyD family protein n=1 Tax=Desulfocurvibacter africanus subsp. africanus str. Walvis Bay TaxID=690850 RepID=F3YVL6_DESAF|nr:secretion protein HlyD [Desulfocurvibacter africanus]EGJ48752.1 secretion protein HlyD family protein [Desulfocurvibacter africanus subsp. africanus str. Walvis Bay]